tara:strand:- start:4394 stop:5776 length:1383 start_codon:yes stop_codon:yes gene_type:complete
MIIKKNITKIFYFFLFFHLFLWTLIPSVSNTNLPLDTIEALAWGSNLDWGFSKHPPFSAFLVNLFYFAFGSNDWAYYFLSQICVIISFLFVWELSKDFFSNRIYSILSILILEAIVFFNYTTPEFNVYVSQLPLKAGLVYFFWKSINIKKLIFWILTGVFAALGILTHYSFIFIILSLFIYFILFVKKDKKIMINFLISFSLFIIFLIPHLFWLLENNFETINYAFNRTGIDNKSLFNHILNPALFILKQIGILSLFFAILFLIISIKKIRSIKFYSLENRKLFLLSVNFLPLILVFFISLISGAKIRTMWMSTFYLFFGLLFFYYLKNIINLNKIKNFLFTICFLFFLSPITYLYVSISNDFKRTDFPGKEIARLVQNKWNDNFNNEIKIIVGDEWSAGNLSYHLHSRPKWINDFKNDVSNVKDNQGVIYTGNPKILKKICPGVFGTIKPYGYCMIGKR